MPIIGPKTNCLAVALIQTKASGPKMIHVSIQTAQHVWVARALSDNKPCALIKDAKELTRQEPSLHAEVNIGRPVSFAENLSLVD
jgi:hypothetical protein